MFALAKAPKPSACRKDMVAPGQSCHEVSIRLNKPYKTCIAVWLRQHGPQFFDWISWFPPFTHLCLHDLLTHQGADAWWNHLGTPYRHGHECRWIKPLVGIECCALYRIAVSTLDASWARGKQYWSSNYAKRLWLQATEIVGNFCIVSTPIIYKTWTPNETPECNMNISSAPKKAIVTNQTQSNKKTHKKKHIFFLGHPKAKWHNNHIAS